MSRQCHPRPAAALLPGAEPRRAHLALLARAIPLAPPLRRHRSHHRGMPHRLEQACRGARKNKITVRLSMDRRAQFMGSDVSYRPALSATHRGSASATARLSLCEEKPAWRLNARQSASATARPSLCEEKPAWRLNARQSAISLSLSLRVGLRSARPASGARARRRTAPRPAPARSWRGRRGPEARRRASRRPTWRPP